MGFFKGSVAPEKADVEDHEMDVPRRGWNGWVGAGEPIRPKDPAQLVLGREGARRRGAAASVVVGTQLAPRPCRLAGTP
jgi:hypothetical protein